MKRNEANHNTENKLLYLFLWSSAYFTVITLLLLFAQALQEESRYVLPSRFLLIYPFSILMAVGNLLIRARSLKISAKLPLHYLLTVLSFYVFLLAPIENGPNPFVVLITLTAVYFAVAIPIAVAGHIKRKKNEEKIPYQSQFSRTK